METVNSNTIIFSDDHWYSVEFIANTLNVCEETIREYIKKDKIKGSKHKVPVKDKHGHWVNREKYMIKATDLAEFLLNYYRRNHNLVSKTTQMQFLNGGSRKLHDI